MNIQQPNRKQIALFENDSGRERKHPRHYRES
jgi:hypothetical protein